MRKVIVSSLLGLFFLSLILIGGWVIWDLQNALNGMKEDLHEVSTQLEAATIQLAETERAHGSAMEEVSGINDDILTLRKTIEEHDAMLQSIGLMLSQ